MRVETEMMADWHCSTMERCFRRDGLLITEKFKFDAEGGAWFEVSIWLPGSIDPITAKYAKAPKQQITGMTVEMISEYLWRDLLKHDAVRNEATWRKLSGNEGPYIPEFERQLRKKRFFEWLSTGLSWGDMVPNKYGVMLGVKI